MKFIAAIIGACLDLVAGIFGTIRRFLRMCRPWLWEIVIIAIVTAGLCILLVGCVKTERQTEGSQQQRREYNKSGTQGGQPFTETGTETVITETVEKEVTKTGLDPEAVKQITANITSGVIAAIAPQLAGLPKSFTGSDKLDHVMELIAALLATKATTKGGAHVLGKLRKPKAG